MNQMKNSSSIFCFLLFVFSANALYAQDQSEIDKLKKRISDMEKKIGIGFGSIKFGGLLQFWALHTDNDDDSLFEDDDTFRIRRAELYFSGEVLPDTLKWNVMVDPASVFGASETTAQTKRMLRNMFLTLEFPRILNISSERPWFSLDVGQMKIPLSLEGYGSSSKLDFLERAIATRTFGNLWDIGLMVRKDYEWFAIQAGIFNGEGQNVINDENDQKNMNARLVIKTGEWFNMIGKAPQIGISIQDGEVGKQKEMRNRIGLDLLWTSDRVLYQSDSGWVKVEYLAGRNDKARTYGWYLAAGYLFMPKWEAVIRLEDFEPSRLVKFNEERDLTLGVNHFIDGHNAKVQLNYVLRDERGKDVGNNSIMLGLQVAF